MIQPGAFYIAGQILEKQLLIGLSTFLHVSKIKCVNYRQTKILLVLGLGSTTLRPGSYVAFLS